ncbi:MAG: DNA gyrase subunit B [Deltaproteobacteria bacterium]|nr:DNA gyrase subunit B [Deltaproteobacteria bacterium]
MASTTYDASTIQVLEGLEPVRKRPAMYIGGTGVEGYHHLLWEIVDNSIDEAMNGHATSVSVTLHADGRSATVSDNGRGIPVEMHPTAKRPALEVILCTLHAGGKFEGKAYAASGGLHGVGSSVVNALSEEMVATVKRGGIEYRQSFRRGKPRSQLEKVGEARGTGTTIKFRPDPDTFGDLAFESDRVRERLETIAYIQKGLRILFRDEISGSYEEFRHDGGIRDWALALARKTGRTPIVPEPFYVCKENGVKVEVALCWTDGTRELFSSYANGIPTSNGGTHETGAKDAITKAVRNYIDTHSLQPKGIALAAEDIREGVVCVSSVFLAEPQFQGQTKEKLNNPEMRGAVENAVRTSLEQFLNHNRTVADIVVTRVVQAARARLASRSAEDQVRRKSPVNNRLNLPGKLADCSSNDARESELFIVEGDSAGGSAKQGRDRETQAILPLRGKVLNTEQASLKKLMENEELSNIVSALGCGIGKDFNGDRLRYHRVILLMDADVDGHHIATLLLTFFYRYLPGLIEAGHLFLAQPPLYRIDVGQQTHWAADDAEKARVLKKLPPRASPEVTRFKGLGEMPPKVLFDTTLDPRKRRLLKVTIPAGEHQSTDQMFADLMGKDAAPRYQAIMESGAEFDELDV